MSKGKPEKALVRSENALPALVRSERAVPIKRTYPSDLKSHFVANLAVQHQQESFVLTFFEVWPPPIFGDTVEEKQKAMEAVKEVEATCVARLVVTPQRMRDFIRVMADNVGQYEKVMQQAAGEEDASG